jgi:hypothetical protein
MKNRRCDFLALLVAISATATTSALAQSATAVPDLSGKWVQLFCCGFAAPPSGPGPVTNKSRRNGLSDLYAFIGDDANPILKPQAAEIVKRHGEMEASGVPYPNPRNQCWPEGLPFAFSNFSMALMQRPHEVTILYDHDHQVRRVRMNEPHPADVTPSWYGDSVGRFDGDTLVIDTIGFKIGSYSMIDWYGTPYTQALHVVERYRLVDDEVAKAAENWTARELRRVGGGNGLVPDPGYKGRALQLQFTVEDAGVFAMPWSSVVTRRRASGEWPEYVCAESLHGVDARKESAVPRADRMDF